MWGHVESLVEKLANPNLFENSIAIIWFDCIILWNNNFETIILKGLIVVGQGCITLAPFWVLIGKTISETKPDFSKTNSIFKKFPFAWRKPMYLGGPKEKGKKKIFEKSGLAIFIALKNQPEKWSCLLLYQKGVKLVKS